MKNVLKIAVAGVAIVFCSFTATAQKIAHIKIDSLIALMPESKVAQQGIIDYGKQLEQQITAMQTELQQKYEAYEIGKKDMAELVRTSKEKELNDLNQRISDFQQQAQADYQKKSAELSKPIYEKARTAIGLVAKEGGYKYVLDTSTEIVLYSEPSDDILNAVIKKLGITPPSGGAATPPKK
jgi:outer membrane protein